jgi:hypothetical protein
MDPDFFWHTLAGGTILATAVTFARLLLDYALRGVDRRADPYARHDRRQRDAEARLERLLQERLAEADRRLEREHLLLLQAHELLKEQHLALQAQRARLPKSSAAERVPRLKSGATARGART